MEESNESWPVESRSRPRVGERVDGTGAAAGIFGDVVEDVFELVDRAVSREGARILAGLGLDVGDRLVVSGNETGERGGEAAVIVAHGDGGRVAGGGARLDVDCQSGRQRNLGRGAGDVGGGAVDLVLGEGAGGERAHQVAGAIVQLDGIGAEVVAGEDQAVIGSRRSAHIDDRGRNARSGAIDGVGQILERVAGGCDGRRQRHSRSG